MGVDGSTALGGSDVATGALSSPGWGPDRFEGYQLRDYLDLRAYYASGSTVAAVRLLSNADAIFNGEVVLKNGAVRAFNTMSLHCVDGAQDVASFRTGPAPGSEVLRVTSAGRVQAAGGADLSLQGNRVGLRASRSGTFGEWGVATFDSGTTERVLDCSGGSLTDPLRVRAYDIRLDAWDYYTAAFDRWGKFSIPALSNTPRRLSAQNASGSVRDLELEGTDIKLRADLGGTGIDYWGSFERTIMGSSLFVPDHLYIKAESSGTYKNIVFDCYKFDVIAQNDDCVRFKDSASAVRFHFKMTGQATLSARNNEHASVTLDSAATSGAKRWTIRADKAGSPAGSLKLVNETDGGTPTVEIEPGGSIYSPGFLGAKVVSAAPSDGDGRVGAVAIDTTNKKVWVKVTDSGSNRWWSASLVSP